AKGAALLLGFELVWNFRFPYWATSIKNFWRHWHVSLSQWLRDYLYIPLGGNRGGTLDTVRNLLVTMTLGGLWHGASWNFVAWGFLHGVALAVWTVLPLADRPASPVGKAFGWLGTMVVVFVGWFLFRATSWQLMSGMFAALEDWEWAPVHSAALAAIATVVVAMAPLEWLLQTRGDFVLADASNWIRYPTCATLAVFAAAMAGHQQATFIYFQF